MDASTRPPQKRHRAAKHLAFSLVAVLLQTAQPTIAATGNLDLGTSLSNIEATTPAAHDIAVTTVPTGEEGLELSARFSEDSAETVNGVEWSITDDQGATVFDGISNIADAQLPAGDYRVSANYGTAHIIQGLTVHEGTKLVVSFVLNAGGLRVLPRIKNIGLAPVSSQSKIYALSGTARGQLIGTSFTPGEVIKVIAGDYRIENRFENGNAISVTDVHVRAGTMSAVNIDHNAGIAHFETIQGAGASWTIQDANGRVMPNLIGTSHDLVLQPGNYSLHTEIAGKSISKKFEIIVGEKTLITFDQ